jgi:MinD-like ATPase involved in chromosome partitioning or flagellar assembly
MEEEKNGLETEKDLDRMTVKELREVAADIENLVGVTAMKKAELLSAIKKAKGIEEKKPVEKADVTIKELKAKIIKIKEKRDEARKLKDKRVLNILRKRINRIKKASRKLPHS